MATNAREVIAAEVEEERTTCRNGWRRAGVSNVRISLQPLRSLRRRVKADINGLSCMLLPFFPRRPHRLAKAWSSSPILVDWLLLRGLGGAEVSRS